MKAVGVRAIGSSSIAARLKLTEEQRVAFAKLTAEFERDTAPLRVVRTVKDFDNKAFDKELDELEKSAAALLTEEQRRRLSALAELSFRDSFDRGLVDVRTAWSVGDS